MKKILLVCFDNVGDLVFCSVLARAFEKDGGATLGLLCKDYSSALGFLLPGVRKVFSADPFWDKSPQRGRGSFWLFLRCIWSLRRESYDSAYIASSCWRTAFFLRLFAGIPRLYGLAGKKNRIFLSRAFPKAQRTEPVVSGLLKSFASVLPTLVDAHTRLDRGHLPKHERPLVLHKKRLVVLHPFAGRADRCAPLELWQQLAAGLKSQDYHVLWTGTKAELDRLRAGPERWAPEHMLDSWADNLIDLAWYWSEAEIFIGHDSGPLHVAHALAVPVLGLYLPGEPKRTFPQGPAPFEMLARNSPKDLTLADVTAAFQKLEKSIKEFHER